MDAAGKNDGFHMARTELGSWVNMEDTRTSVVASVVIANTCCGHVAHAAEKLPRLVSLIEGCGK